MSADADYLRATRTITERVVTLVTRLVEASEPDELPAIFRAAAEAIEAEEAFRVAWLWGQNIQNRLVDAALANEALDDVLDHAEAELGE